MCKASPRPNIAIGMKTEITDLFQNNQIIKYLF